MKCRSKRRNQNSIKYLEFDGIEKSELRKYTMKEKKRVTWAEEMEKKEEINNSERKKEKEVLCFICEEKEVEGKEWGEFCEECGKMLMKEDGKLKKENQGQKNNPEE